jgi:hypothetical protein
MVRDTHELDMRIMCWIRLIGPQSGSKPEKDVTILAIQQNLQVYGKQDATHPIWPAKSSGGCVCAIGGSSA